MRQKPKREFIKRSRLLKNRTHPVGGRGKSERGQRQNEQSMAQLVKFYKVNGRNNLIELLSTPHILWYATLNYQTEVGRLESFHMRVCVCVCMCECVALTGSDSDWGRERETDWETEIGGGDSKWIKEREIRLQRQTHWFSTPQTLTNTGTQLSTSSLSYDVLLSIFVIS